MAMTSTTLPPQAYTRDTLVKAIEWLTTQPASVRERAQSADLIVSFYLQARRRTAAQMEAPISTANFQSDLKHLAQNMNRFEEPSKPAPPPPPSPRIPLQTFFDEAKLAQPMPSPAQSTPPPPPQQAAPAPSAPAAALSTVPVTLNEPTRLPETVKTITWTVDPRSFAVARDLKQRLNLSDEGEALRLLISLGKERAGELFPET